MYGDRNGPRWRELLAKRIANAERARIHNLDWRARVAERERNLRHGAMPESTCWIRSIVSAVYYCEAACGIRRWWRARHDT